MADLLVLTDTLEGAGVPAPHVRPCLIADSSRSLRHIADYC
jgi:hypothetical protein